MAQLQGVLFDVDGTLVDSNDAHTHAWVEAFQEKGYDATFERVRGLIGMGGDKMVPEVTGLDDKSAEGKALKERWGEIFKASYQPTLKPFPGVPELLQHMRERGLRLIAASSAQQEQLDALLKIARVTDLMEGATSSDEAKHSKPDPDIFQAALGKLKLQADQAIVIGDTPYDVQAASKAGLRTIALRCGGWNDPDFPNAIAVYDDPADLLTHYDASPLARD